jgi:hypothetical protein
MKRIVMMLVCCVVCVSWNASAFDPDQIQIHGFASQGYLRSNHYDYLGAETEDGTVEFNEFGLDVMSNLTDHLRFGIQLFARDFGDVGNDKVTIDWAFGDYRYRNWLGLRIGKFKKAFGMYNQIRDIDAARTAIFLPTSVYSESTRSVQKSIVGIMAYGVIPGGLEYQAQYGTLDPEVEVDLFKNSPSSAENKEDAYALSLAWNTPIAGLKLVGTVGHFSLDLTMSGQPPSETPTQEFTSVITEPTVGIEYTRGPVTCAAEYRQIQYSDEGRPQRTTESYYGLLSYRFTDWVELAASYAVNYPDKDDKEGKNSEPKAAAWLKDLAVSARFDLNDIGWLNSKGIGLMA